MYYTTKATEWRIAIRRKMNESDTDANTKAVDSLLNFETVKYFGAEERETERYDTLDGALREGQREGLCLARHPQRRAGGDLHRGPDDLHGDGGASASATGRHTLGDFVMINAMLIQLYQPLNFMGMVYREIKQALIDIEQMFDILDRKPEIAGQADAPSRCVVDRRPRPLRGRALRLRSRAARSCKGVSFEVPAGQDGRHRRPVGRRQVDHLAPAVPLLRAAGRPHPRSTARTSPT